MAKTRAPLLAFGASGQIGKTQVYATWRGVPYARQLVKPSNPRSSGQTETRSVFSYLNALWKLAPSLAQAPWTANAAGRPYTNRNKFISANLTDLRPATDLSTMIGSPGANGGLAPASVSATGGSGTATMALTAPTLPTGWTITQAVAWLIPDGDPHSLVNVVSYAGFDNSTPFSVALSTIPAGDYVMLGWFEYAIPGSRTAYGPSLLDAVTVT